MKNAPRCLQYVVEEALKDVDASRVKIYQGQILVHSSSYVEHLRVLRDALAGLRAYNLKIDLDESIFLTDELIYLGRLLICCQMNLDGNQLTDRTHQIEVVHF